MRPLGSRLGGRCGVAAAAGVLCLLLALLIQVADFVHDHPERLGCDIEHPAARGTECEPRVHFSRLAPARSIDDARRGGACLVCRWSRGPLLHDPPQVWLGAPEAPRRFALTRLLPERRPCELAGFLNRAPPRAA